jgi:hypothetical protein
MFSQTKSVRDDMYKTFLEYFDVGKHYNTRDELKQASKAFSEKYNVVFSIAHSSSCRHHGDKQIVPKPISLEEVKAAADLNTTEESDVEKKKIKKSTQKVKCPAFIKFYNSTVTKFDMTHNHPIPQDMTIYAINRKQEPEMMQRIYSILANIK